MLERFAIPHMIVGATPSEQPSLVQQLDAKILDLRAQADAIAQRPWSIAANVWYGVYQEQAEAYTVIRDFMSEVQLTQP